MPNNLLLSFRDFVVREHLFTHDDKLLLACSGGLDSTVLAHLLHAEGYDFDIAHMNFQLRGEDSDGDAAFVENLARSLGAKFWTKAVDVKAEAKDGESTQMTCRRLRWQWFGSFEFRTGTAYKALTGHHQDDNLETFFINLFRNNGVAGLRAMPPSDGTVVRPLLCASRADIEAFARTQNIRWREDASNASDDYLRNRIRHHLTPLLDQEFGFDAARFRQTARNLQSDYRLRKATLDRFRARYCRVHYHFKVVVQRDDWEVADRPYFKDFFYHIASEYDFTSDQVQQMLRFEGQRTISNDRYHALITPASFTFVQRQHTEQPLREVFLEQLPYHDAVQDISLELIPRPEKLDEAGVLYLAPPSLPLHLRPRQHGDRFPPLGLKGRTKKVKDYMIDAKIPVWLRDRIYLLTDANDEIMAISGYCISEPFKVLPEHKEVLRISRT